MNRDETKRILMIIQCSYPNFNVTDRERLTNMIDVWSVMLSDYPYKTVEAALKTYIATNATAFAPSIGQLIEKINSLSMPEIENEMEAWAMVSKAIRNGYYGAEQEFQKLPPLVQKAVGAPGQLHNWAMTDSESVENVIQSNFMRTYRSVVARELEVQKMPSDVRQAYLEKCEREKENRITQRQAPDVLGEIPKRYDVNEQSNNPNARLVGAGI